MRGRSPLETSLGPAELCTPRTRLQSLILLTLLSLPATFIPTKPRKGKRKKHPELFSDTLDPAMLLDFLTDRMQIWRVMRDVGGIGIAGERGAKAENDLAEPLVAVEEKDLVQQWWMDIVEPLCVTPASSGPSFSTRCG